MRGKWVVRLTKSNGHLIMSSGDLYHDDWVQRFVSRYIRCMDSDDLIYIHQIEVKRKRLTNPVFAYKEYE